MFLGQYAHTVDTKGRTFVPAKYRDELGETFVVTRGTAKCLTVYPMSEWEKYTAKIAELPQAHAAKIRRFVFSNASDVTLDAQGRIGLVAGLREYAGIEKNVIILGLGSYIEIWAEDVWKAENEMESGGEIEDLMLALGF
jgi:MraZ protein